MSVLVTGAAGYLGAHVLKRLRAQGHLAVGTARSGVDLIACNLTSASDANGLLSSVKPAVVVHCAAAMPGRGAAGYDDEDAAAQNVRMVRNLVEAGAPRIVFISSMTVYSERLPMPVTEALTDPQSAYARTKLAAERLLLESACRATILRIPGLFGPPRTDGLVYRLCRALMRDEPLELPKQPLLWAAIQVEDAAAIVARAAIENKSDHSLMNVGYPGYHSVNRMVDIVAKATGKRVATTVEHPDFAMNLERLESSYGLPSKSLRDRVLELLHSAGMTDYYENST